MHFKSLKLKILLWFALISGLIIFIFSYTFYSILEHSIIANIESSLHEKALFIKNNLYVKNLFEDESLHTVDIAIFHGNEIKKKKGKISFEEIQPYLKLKSPYTVIEKDEMLNILYLLQDNGKVIALFQRNIPNKAEDVEDTLWVLDPFLFFLLLFLANALIDKILIPIKKITQTANEISISDFSKSIEEPKDENELKALVQAFNKMIERLKSGVVNMEQFNNDVSHELKTPLTVIKGEVEVTLDRPRETQEYIQSLKIIEEEATHIENIVNELLLLSRYSKSTVQSSFEMCNLEGILTKVLQTYEQKLKDKNLTLHVKKIEPLSLQANALLIETIFSNLLDNAIKYTPKDKNIFLSLYEENGIHFVIKDEGIGIPKDKLPFITQRFYRVDDSRNNKTKGFGLGLAIVQNAVFLHDGSLHVSSSQTQGTTIRIVF